MKVSADPATAAAPSSNAARSTGNNSTLPTEHACRTACSTPPTMSCAAREVISSAAISECAGWAARRVSTVSFLPLPSPLAALPLFTTARDASFASSTGPLLSFSRWGDNASSSVDVDNGVAGGNSAFRTKGDAPASNNAIAMARASCETA